MKALPGWSGIALRGGFTLVEVLLEPDPMTDAIGRPAVAKAIIIGKKIEVRLQENLSEKELSISLYHEILEAVTVASFPPPESVMEWNEADFEAVAQQMHQMLGLASVINLNLMLEMFGF